jgi:hypothetical protein
MGLGGDQADLDYARIFVGIVPSFYIFGIYRPWFAVIETFPSFPIITAAKALEGIDDLALDADAKACFLGGNAARVFGINQ